MNNNNNNNNTVACISVRAGCAMLTGFLYS